MSDIQSSSVNIPFLERYYIHPGKYDNEISLYLPNSVHMTLDELIERYASPRSFKRAWLQIYKLNHVNIEKFIRGDYSKLDKIDFNNLVKLLPLAWPKIKHNQLYFKEPGNYTLQDYLNIANRLWAINLCQH